MVPEALPPQPFAESAFQVAYERCLALESAAEAGLKPHSDCPPPLVCARLLGHLLRLAPNSNGRRQLQREITLAENDNKLMEIARLYFIGFIRAFKRSSGPTPAPSEHPSRPSFEDARAYTMELMQQAQLDHRKARDAALLRSDYCCMITGRRSLVHGGLEYLQVAHIVPESINASVDENERKIISSTFTDIDIVPKLAGNMIHRLENILLIFETGHHLFDDLRLWFKPVEGRPHTYRVHLVPEGLRKLNSIPEIVQFTTDKADLPLPDGAYLALHALCCEVAWMSGAAEYVMDIERRMDATRVLANDGSTADLLASALAHVLVH